MTTFLFWFQLIMAWVYVVPQAWKMANNETEGLTLAMYAIFATYLIFSLSLAVSAYREKPDKVRRQTIIIFSQWVVFNFLLCLLGARSIIWTRSDSVVTLSVLAFSLITVYFYRGVTDPMARGLISIWCKSVPQLWLSCTMLLAGSSIGLPLITVVAGHMTSVPRFFQVYFSGKSGGWDRPTKGLFVSEFCNVATWSIVTLCWCYLRLRLRS